MTIEIPAENVLSPTSAEDIGNNTLNIGVKNTNEQWCVWYNYVTKEAELYRIWGTAPHFTRVPCSFTQGDMEFFELLSQHYGSTYQRVEKGVV